MIVDWINVSERTSLTKNDSPSDDHHDIKSNLYDKSESRNCSDTNCDCKIDTDNKSSN